MSQMTAKLRKPKKYVWYCWLFVTPNLIFYALFQGWPIIINWYYAMLDWSGMTASKKFVFLDNFKELVADPYFWNAYKNSFIFMLGSVPAGLVLSLIIAVILNHPLQKLSKIYRTIIFIPVVTTTSVIGIIMVFIWSADGGVNYILTQLQIIKAPINWLSDAKYAMLTAIIIYIWKNLGMNMIYWIAGLQGIPQELYEAAKVDGANALNTFFKITLPLIVPIGLVISLLNIAASLKVFDLIKTMTNGGPFFATDVVSTYIYRYAFSSEIGLPRLGYASAAGIFFAFTIIAFGIIQILSNRIVTRIKEERK